MRHQELWATFSLVWQKDLQTRDGLEWLFVLGFPQTKRPFLPIHGPYANSLGALKWCRSQAQRRYEESGEGEPTLLVLGQNMHPSPRPVSPE